MTKKAILVLFLLFISFIGFSQKAGFGIKAGGNMAILSGTFNHPDSWTVFKRGLHFGLFGDFRVAKAIALQPEIVYSAQGFRKITWGNEITTSLNYLNIPVMAKIYLGKSFYLQTGPQLGILLSAREKGNGFQGTAFQFEIDENVKKDYKSSDLSICFGLGVDLLKRFSISGRYNLGLTNLDNGPNSQANRDRANLGPLTSRVLQFSFGVKLGKVNQEAVSKNL